MKYKISTLKPEEFDEMMLFLEKSYRHYRNYFPKRYPHVWRKDTIDYDNKLVLKIDSKIVSHVGIFKLMLDINGIKLKVGGIGAVATLQEHRGKGYMSILMREAIKKMKREGYPFSILWGDRQRYGHFGYETAGRGLTVHISSRSLEQEYNPQKVEFQRFYGEEQLLRKIINSHEKEPLKVLRSRRDYELIFNKDDLMTYVSEHGSYISFYHGNPSHFVEVGGDPHDLVSLVYSVLSEVGRDKRVGSISILLPFYPYEEVQLLMKVGYYWKIEAVGLGKILNLFTLLEAYEPLISRRSKDIDLELTLEIKETGEKVGISIHRGEVEIIKDREFSKKVSLNEREMVRFLFVDPEIVAGSLPLIKEVFPLPFYIWPLDHI